MSFGSKLHELPTVPPHGETTATVWLVGPEEPCEQESEFYLEELDGTMRVMKVRVKFEPRASQ